MTASALFVGLATLDLVQLVDAVPAPNQKVAAHDFQVCAGGPAANAAVAYGRCGGDASLVTALPRHELTPLITGDLAACGVSVIEAARYGGPPVTASILVTRASGDRAVVSPSAVGTSARLTVNVEASLEGVSAVMLDGYFPDIALPLAARARAAGIPVLMDAGSHKPHTDAVVEACDLVIASDDFAPPGTSGEPDAVFEYLFARGVGAAVISRGASPVLYRTPASSGTVAVPPVPRVVDTLGAGDFFHGALTWRVASLGRDDARLGEDIAFAASVVAPSLGSFGTRAWLS